ncbi:MAG: hypothetical protein KDA32_13015 [Phycisphaerales bacterium]|nr:hypothetical protein [Phycisphaerales bacterium]
MDATSFIDALMNTLRTSLNANWSWAPPVGLGVAALFGITMLARGAKLTPSLAVGAVATLAAWAGYHFAPDAIQPWISAIITGVVGGVLGIVFVRFWMATLVSALFVTAAVGVYGYQLNKSHPDVWQDFESRHYNPELGVATLRSVEPEGAVATAGESWMTQAGELWTYLGQNVPSFQTTFVAIALLTSIAGLVFGLVLPGASRAVWSASIGTLMCGCGAVGLCQMFWPTAYGWMMRQDSSAWFLVGGVWMAGFIYNWMQTRKRKAAKNDDGEGEPAVA